MCVIRAPPSVPLPDGLQRPPSEPPPPPPPPPDSSPSPTSASPRSQPVFFARTSDHVESSLDSPSLAVEREPEGGTQPETDSLVDAISKWTPQYAGEESLTDSIVRKMGWSEKDLPTENGHESSLDHSDYEVIHGSFASLSVNDQGKGRQEDLWSFLLNDKPKPEIGIDKTTVKKNTKPMNGKPAIPAEKPKCHSKPSKLSNGIGGSGKVRRAEKETDPPVCAKHAQLSPPVTQTKPVLVRLTSFTTDPEAPVLPALEKPLKSPAGSFRRHVERSINPAMIAPQVPAHAYASYQEIKSENHVKLPPAEDGGTTQGTYTHGQHRQPSGHSKPHHRDNDNHYHHCSLPPPLPPRPGLPHVGKLSGTPKHGPGRATTAITGHVSKPTNTNGLHVPSLPEKEFEKNGHTQSDNVDAFPPPPPPPPPLLKPKPCEVPPPCPITSERLLSDISKHFPDLNLSFASDQPCYNKHINISPAPATPTSPTVQNNGWGGTEIYDPREEEGDPYDTVDMSFKFC
ncbi:hypothetical protein PoB_005281900 [Plakobranchus ocellatus]|uniref:Uncharacterized protein n=1 Tax=Plakobranchus ocellatus TaxID=259542 RepID=A0AAV4C1D6_9GAST|nr:hypothetical protein PoB_005281900 [Plakobranchus ocellatus]